MRTVRIHIPCILLLLELFHFSNLFGQNITTTAGNFTMDGKVATTVGLLPTEEIRTDGADNVYIIESASRIIRKINTATGIINTVAGGGNLIPADGIRATNASF